MDEVIGCLGFSLKMLVGAMDQWLTLTIPATQEAEIRRIAV
jgi:hypothetical protein